MEQVAGGLAFLAIVTTTGVLVVRGAVMFVDWAIRAGYRASDRMRWRG